MLLNVREDLPRAEEHLRAAIELDPSFAAHRKLATVFERREDLDGAIREMLAYVRISGDPSGSGAAYVAELRAMKKFGRAAKPDAEAQARSPPLHRGRARALQSC